YLPEINDTIAYLQDACVLSQSLGGLRDRLTQRNPRRYLPPDQTALGPWLSPPDAPGFSPTAAPAPASDLPYSPLQSGLLRLDRLWVVDDFGQVYDVLENLAVHAELGGVGLGPDLSPAAGPGLGLMKPRLLQAS